MWCLQHINPRVFTLLSERLGTQNAEPIPKRQGVEDVCCSKPEIRAPNSSKRYRVHPWPLPLSHVLHLTITERSLALAITTRWESSKWQIGAYLYNVILAVICLLLYGMPFASKVDKQGGVSTSKGKRDLSGLMLDIWRSVNHQVSSAQFSSR